MPRSPCRSSSVVDLVVARQPDLSLLARLVGEFYTESGHALDATRRVLVCRALERLVADDSLGRAWVIRAAGEGAEHAGYMVVTLGFSIEHGGRDAFVDQ